MTKSIEKAIHWLILLGFLTLPYTHLKWMPDLGTTRPVTTVCFALALGLIAIKKLVAEPFRLSNLIRWPARWDNWSMLRWWVLLIVAGIISVAITPFYGSPIQAAIRLLGYFGIFSTLFIGAYSLSRYGIERIAFWVAAGYLPILAYALVEMMGILGVRPAFQVILSLRNFLLIPFNWGDRISLLATEPSFVGFQLILLALVLPYVRKSWLRYCGWTLVIICLALTKSGTVLAIAAAYLIMWGLFALSRRSLVILTSITVGVAVLAVVVTWSVPQVQSMLNNVLGMVFSTNRLRLMSISGQIRFYYVANLYYAILDTHGLGLGIGQYGLFWKEIYLRHIDYRTFDPTGEMARALANPAGDYMKPWSVLLGIGADLGILGLALLVGFLQAVFRQLAEPRHRALFFACLVALAGAYPIITPHVWLAMALMAGLGLQNKPPKVAA
jgi:hypothetical protein